MRRIHQSIYTRILLWLFGTLLISLVAFFLISRWVAFRQERPGGFVSRFHALELRQAVAAFDRGGPEGARVFLREAGETLESRLYLIDKSGRDVATGEQRSALLARLRGHWNLPIRSADDMVVGRVSADGRFRFIVISKPNFSPWSFIPYYGLVLLAVALLCWPLAINIASPLRALAGAVDCFGKGDLAIRLKSRRGDEIGELARSFNQMADRIETLLVAERRLLQDVSHELRSPLARLSFAAELTRTATDRDGAVARLKKEISRLKDLVGALLEVTRAEGDPGTRTRKPIRLDRLLAEVLEDCQVEAATRRCSLQYSRAGEVTVSGDPELIRRATENVLRNAIYFSPEDSRVEVMLSVESERARIAVRDYGPGVPKELLPKIFQPFFRVDDSRNSSTGGVGLGLSIVQRAVNIHHGEVRAVNAQPGLLIEIDFPVSGDA